MLKEYLNDRKISIYSLSKKIGIPYSTLNDICNGKVDIDNCKISIIKKLSDYFNISLDKIYSICFNDDTKVYLKEYRVTGNIYTKNKSYYVSSKYNNEDINKRICNVDKYSKNYIKTMATWLLEDYIKEKEMERMYVLLLNEKR